ncbi:hypothetical protein NPIL_265041 [Nephila pilipes]|uniref:Uncharacterized protein n=1 Tax=Nephila pilipes TaxID=299642 RepID=A0A8X6TUR2_NEPPI|nr:hypothetical protein NPIL_265041 [Nephila pilipes]
MENWPLYCIYASKTLISKTIPYWVHGSRSSTIKLEKRVNHRILTVGSCLLLDLFLEELWEDHHKMVQDNWSVKKSSKLLEEFDTSSLQMQTTCELSVYFNNPVLKLKDAPLKVYHDN